jgi:hypothetical protein
MPSAEWERRKGVSVFLEKCAENEASSSDAIGLLACGLLDLGGRRTTLSTPEFGPLSGPNADIEGLSFIGIEVSISLNHLWLLEIQI